MTDALLLPALLAIVGRRVERSIERGAQRRLRRARPPEGSGWRRWAALVQRRPWLATVLPVAGLLALAAPALDMRLGFADAGNGPESATSRQAYDLLATGFGPGFNGPLVVVVSGPVASGAAASAQGAIEATQGVAAVTPPLPTNSPDVATLIVFPQSKPQDAGTDELVNRLRTDVLPALAGQTGATYLVGGSTAAVMMIVLQYHGMVLGPRLFSTNPEVAYGVFVAMAVAYIFMIFTILPLARYMSRIVLIETTYLAPIIVLVTIVAAFGERQYAFDMALALVFGVIGYIAHKTNYHVTAILIGIILGPLFEQYLVRSLRISQGDFMILFSSTIGNTLWALLALSLLLPFLRTWRQKKALVAEQFGDER